MQSFFSNTAKALTVMSCVFVSVLVFDAGVHSAAAASREEVPSRLVRFGDLDLNSPQDREQLDRRVARAARDICRHVGDPRFTVFHRCVKDVIGDAQEHYPHQRDGSSMTSR